MANGKWNGYKSKRAKKSEPAKITKFPTLLLCLMMLLFVLVLMYIYYPTILPQLASFLTDQGSPSTQAGDATILKINYVKG